MGRGWPLPGPGRGVRGMGLAEQMPADAANVIMNTEEFAEWISYKGARIKAICALGGDRASGNTFTNDGQAARMIVDVLETDVAAPAEGDSIIREADTAGAIWRVARVLSSFGGLHRLECIARETPWG